MYCLPWDLNCNCLCLTASASDNKAWVRVTSGFHEAFWVMDEGTQLLKKPLPELSAPEHVKFDGLFNINLNCFVCLFTFLFFFKARQSVLLDTAIKLSISVETFINDFCSASRAT